MEDENSKGGGGGMGGLQRSAISFRRQGSSGLVWEDRFLSGELNQIKKKEEEEVLQDQEHRRRHHHQNRRHQQQEGGGELKVAVMERSRSAGATTRVYRTGKVSPAIDPPSPKVSACGFCGVFGKSVHGGGRRSKTSKRKT